MRSDDGISFVGRHHPVRCAARGHYAKGEAKVTKKQNPKQCVICRSSQGTIKLIKVQPADRRRGWLVYVHQECLDKLREDVKK